MKIKVIVAAVISFLILQFTSSDLTDADTFKDVESSSYYPLNSPQLVVKKGPQGTFDSLWTHTLSIVELNRNGYRFWGYYTGFNGTNLKKDVGLAYSNDLVHWEKEGTSPVIPNLRWGTAVVVDGIVNIFGTRNYDTDSRIVRLTSEDGKKFVEHEVVVPSVKGERHQNAFIFYDEVSEIYRLYYFHLTGGKNNYIEEKHSKDITKLGLSQPNVILSDSQNILAAPSVFYRDGKYWLTAETLQPVNGVKTWKTIAYVSENPIDGFLPVDNYEILTDQDACFFPYIFDNKLNGVYSHKYNDGTWELYNRTHEFKFKNMIKLNENEISLSPGDKRHLSATGDLYTGEIKNITRAATWATSDNSTVSVRKGKIFAKKEGTAIITVSYGGVSTKAVVTVHNAEKSKQ